MIQVPLAQAATAKQKTKKYNVVGSRLFDPHIGVDQSLYCDHLRIKIQIGIGMEQSGTNGHIKTIGMEQRQSSNGSIKTIGMNQRGVIKTIGMITAVAATLSDGKCNDLLAIYRSRG